MAELSSEHQLLLNELKAKVNLRDQMGGNLYWSILNDECCQLANKCISLGCEHKDISAILGSGTFIYGRNGLK